MQINIGQLFILLIAIQTFNVDLIQVGLYDIGVIGGNNMIYYFSILLIVNFHIKAMQLKEDNRLLAFLSLSNVNNMLM